MRLLTCNRSTSAMGACFSMALLSYRMCIVVLANETLNVNHQLGARPQLSPRLVVSSSVYKNERACQVFRDEVADLRRQNAALPSQIKKLARGQTYHLKVLERGGCIRPRKKPRADGAGGDDRHRT
uniref:RxLR effector candidate protein n=1 Tax=Hyaloperonospora arabidopsidis (strain Emoy2) TaxID=559515 RepID=M4BAH8_HYAAE